MDLVVSPGVPLGLVGENGTGKSTLLRLLAGIEPADAGDVLRPDDLAYLAQDPDFSDADTIGDSPGGRTPALARSGRTPGAARGRPRRPSRRGRVREPARVGGPARRLGRRPSRGRSGGPARARRSRSRAGSSPRCPAVSAPGWPSPPSWRDAPPAYCSTSPPTISTTVRSSSSSRSSSTCPAWCWWPATTGRSSSTSAARSSTSTRVTSGPTGGAATVQRRLLVVPGGEARRPQPLGAVLPRRAGRAQRSPRDREGFCPPGGAQPGSAGQRQVHLPLQGRERRTHGEPPGQGRRAANRGPRARPGPQASEAADLPWRGGA